ncbi:ACP S-malonyltransferase [Candidatus Vondammii sp. HM_W22]|uniref:ACP S-malonyltransferase n=1 Tax=Candidatus Vondammii sp. HM_W22 TaxID=2687299 RepID=UPI001F12B362|nr:ACP S-malonyltransferase [Candidatus Vondammii sp. HM_W22]
MSDNEQRAIFIFPGQGSQYPGIGSDLSAEFDSVRKIYQQASDVLGYDMAKLSFEDPDQQINLTRFTQPLLLTHHIACLTVYRELAENPIVPVMSGGHSLGEYSALVAAEALSYEDALKLVSRRGELMGTHGEGEMAALTVDLEIAQPLSDKHFCGIAGLNLPDQTVVGGATADLDALSEEMAELYPKKRAVRLKTEGAFHTYYMVTAAREFRKELDKVEIKQPGLKVLSNYTGGFHQADAETIKSRLFFQLFHPVNWVGCLQSALDDGVNLFVEFGGGIGSGEGPAEKRPNLEGIIKKFTRRAKPRPEYMPAINIESIKAVAESTP